MCYPRLSPAQSCHHLPPALLLTGNSWIGDTGAQGRWALGPGRCVGAALQCTGVGASLCTPLCSGVGARPLSPGATLGKAAAAGGAHPSPTAQGVPGCRDMLGWEPRRGTQAAHGALRGCSTAFVALLGRGSVARRQRTVPHTRFQCGSQPPPAPWQSPFLRRGRAASEHGEGPGSSTAPLSAPPSCPVATPAACASSQPRRGSGGTDSPKQPSPPWQHESQNCTRHVLAAWHVE